MLLSRAVLAGPCPVVSGATSMTWVWIGVWGCAAVPCEARNRAYSSAQIVWRVSGVSLMGSVGNRAPRSEISFSARVFSPLSGAPLLMKMM